jgi:hypothetical protein
MKIGLTLFARGVVLLVGLAAVAICVILLPELVREELVGKPASAATESSFFLGVAYLLAVPFFIALFQTHKLLNLLDNGKAFSRESIIALQNVKICAVVFAILVVLATIAGITYAKMMDPREDVTFMVPFGIVFTFLPTIIAVFVAVLQKLLVEAMSMKDENDLIV